MAQVWYPAKRSRRPVAEYMEPAVAATYAEVPAGTLTGVRTHSHVAAPVASGRHPVVVLATGGFEARSIYTLHAEELAAQGFIVVAVDHTHEARAVVFPDGRVVPPAYPIPATLEELAEFVTQAAAVRVADTRFVLDRLERLGRRGRLAGRLDLSRIGMVGHSLGGAVAAEMLRTDSRVDAAVDLDGLILPVTAARGLDRPFMVINAPPSATLPESWPFTDGYDRGPGSLWANLRGPRLSLMLEQSAHMDFSDLVVWKAQITAPEFHEANDVGAIGSARAVQVIRAYVGGFLQRHVRNRPAPLLAGPSSAYPEMKFLP